MQSLQQVLEAAAIFGEVDGLGGSADDGDMLARERGGQVDGGLAAELDNRAWHPLIVQYRRTLSSSSGSK